MLIYYPVGGGTRVKWVLSLRQGHLHYLRMKHVATKERPTANGEANKVMKQQYRYNILC